MSENGPACNRSCLQPRVGDGVVQLHAIDVVRFRPPADQLNVAVCVDTETESSTGIGMSVPRVQVPVAMEKMSRLGSVCSSA
jgi:hypothetical protein